MAPNSRIEEGHTNTSSVLNNWIHNLRVKRFKKRRSMRMELRVDAMLSSSLFNAETELRRRHIEMIERWQKIKAIEMELLNCTKPQQNVKPEYDPFKDPDLKDDLANMTDFLDNLGKRKVKKTPS